MTMKIPESYKGPIEKFCIYWKIYGGWRAMIRSAYLHAAIVFTALAAPIWLDKNLDWTGIVLDVTPSILGFSLGGYAVLFAFGDQKFQYAISGQDPDGTPSPFMELNASFVHFLVVNILALLVAILARAWVTTGSCLMGVVFLIFAYSVFTAIAMVMAVFSVARWADMHAEMQKEAEAAATE